MKKLTLVLLSLCSLTQHARSQGILFNPEIIGDDTKENAQLYTISPEQRNHHFEYKLPDDGTLQIDFLRLSDWGEKNRLKDFALIAAQQAAGFRDSFRSATSTKTFLVNIPINEEVLSINYSEDGKEQNQMAFKEGTYYHLKTGYDTLRIVKNVSIRTRPQIDSGLVQIQYTFILKNLSDIEALAKDPDLLPRLGRITDSVIAAKRKGWSRQDAMGHNVSLYVDATHDDSLHVHNNRYDNSFPFGLYVSIGAIAYNGAISPFSEMGIAYLFPTRKKYQYFAGFSFSGFGMVAADGKTIRTTKGGYVTYDLEVGNCRKGPSFMSGKTSFLFGVMTVSDEKSLFHMGINVAVSRLASVGLTLGGNFKKQDNGGRYVYGINFKFNY